ncbi:MAG TPA: addiction module protein [Myxococcota bacterium]|nr:addiction module protein [Myxococcota bacterium]
MTRISLTPELESAVKWAASQQGVSDQQFVLDAVQNELERLREEGDELHPEWGPELARRIEAMDTGKAKMIPGEEAMAGLRSHLVQRRRAAL